MLLQQLALFYIVTSFSSHVSKCSVLGRCAALVFVMQVLLEAVAAGEGSGQAAGVFVFCLGHRLESIPEVAVLSGNQTLVLG